MRGREALAILMASGSGRVGIALLVLLVLTSVYALATHPLDFGTRFWSNPAVWADNPRAAPPAWTGLLPGRAVAAHRVFETTTPASTIAAAGVETRLYSFPFRQESGAVPTLISFSVSQVEFYAGSPQVTLELQRPDGRRVVLLRHVVRGSRATEETPFLRYQETPNRVNLSADPGVLVAVADFLQTEFGRQVAPRDLQGRVAEALFGVPLDGTALAFQPLSGEYQFTVRATVRDPRDSIGHLKLVLGGTTYGLMGTDALGRDLAVGLLFGFPVALAIGMVTAFVTTCIGTFLGILSGFSGGKTDIAIQRFADIIGNMPVLPLLIFLVFALGQKLWLVVVVLILFSWPGLTIVIRSMVLQIRTGQLVEATQTLGASRWRIMFRHLLFQIAPFVLAQIIFFTPAAILAEAGLSFLGLGDPSLPTWGQILESGNRTGAVYLGYWWWVLPPGLLIVVTALTFALMALALEPVVNPRLRGAR